MATVKKLGNPTGVGEWRDLATPADVKRLFKWLILSIRGQTIPPQTAAIMAQIGAYLLKGIETADLAERLTALERKAAGAPQGGNHAHPH